MKYICTIGEDDLEEIFMFPCSIDHDCMEEVLARIKDRTDGNWKRQFRTPISAGFVDVHGTCYGESITLGLESRGEADTILLTKQRQKKTF